MRRVRSFDLEHLSRFSTITALFVISFHGMDQLQVNLIYEDTLGQWSTLYNEGASERALTG